MGDTISIPEFDRETLGRMVRASWIRWAKTQPAPKASWLAEWEDLSEPDKEVDRQIGERIANFAACASVEELLGKPRYFDLRRLGQEHGPYSPWEETHREAYSLILETGQSPAGHRALARGVYEIAAKDAEIAELRRRLEIFQDAERGALELAGLATTERDEARESVGRLCGEISEAVKMLCMDRPISPANYLIVALAATPEHLRGIP